MFLVIIKKTSYIKINIFNLGAIKGTWKKKKYSNILNIKIPITPNLRNIERQKNHIPVILSLYE